LNSGLQFSGFDSGIKLQGYVEMAGRFLSLCEMENSFFAKKRVAFFRNFGKFLEPDFAQAAAQRTVRNGGWGG